MCVRIEADFTPTDDTNVVNSENGTNPNVSMSRIPTLADRIPKIWEIEAAKETNQQLLDEQRILEKTEAYGLTVGISSFAYLVIYLNEKGGFLIR